MNRQRPNQNRQALFQQAGGLVRTALLVSLPVIIAYWAAVHIEGVFPEQVLYNFLLRVPGLSILPDWSITWFAVIVFSKGFRYIIAPVTAILAIYFYAAFFVKDIYALERFRDALHYVISSMTSVRWPRLEIRNGEKVLKRGVPNLLDEIGGPGYVIIQPGNAVLFRQLRRPSNISIRESYFMMPFETIGQIANLDDQQEDKDGITAITRDGIRVTVKDIHFRYRIFPEMKYGSPIRRSLEDPYPYDEKAIWNMAYNLTVTDTGLDPWRTAVARATVGGITDFINLNTVDYLTAPREDDQDPRRVLRHNLFQGDTKFALRNVGAELLWSDVGHLSIDDESVDNQRAETWGAEWTGRAQVIRAYGEAKRQTYLEMGRSEAQAELIMNIAEIINGVNTGDNAHSMMRQMFLSRVAQLLDAMAENGRREEERKQ
jgi:hypothetical protein